MYKLLLYDDKIIIKCYNKYNDVRILLYTAIYIYIYTRDEFFTYLKKDFTLTDQTYFTWRHHIEVRLKPGVRWIFFLFPSPFLFHPLFFLSLFFFLNKTIVNSTLRRAQDCPPLYNDNPPALEYQSAVM